MENEKEIGKCKKKMEYKPLNITKEENKDEKEKIVRPKKVIIKKDKEPKSNNIKNNEKEIKAKILDDDLDHPIPLESDYYEEGKEELKNDFYQNKLKEKERLKKKNYINENLLNDRNLKIVKRLEKSFDSTIPPKLQPVQNIGHKQNINSTNLETDSVKRIENSSKIKKVKTIFDSNTNMNIKNDISLKQKIIEKKIDNKVYNENINININKYDNNVIKFDNQQKNNNLVQNLQTNDNQINKNQKPIKAVSKTKQSNQIKKVIKKQSHQQVNTINKSLQQGKINQKNKSQKVVKNQTNIIPKQEYDNNSLHTINQTKVASNRIIQRIQKSMDYDKINLYNDPVNKTYKIEKPKYTEISIQDKNPNENNSQLCKNNNYECRNRLEQNNQLKVLKKKFIQDKLEVKSQSYCNMNLNKIVDNDYSNINRNTYIPNRHYLSRENLKTQKIEKQKPIKNIPLMKVNKTNEPMNTYKEKNKKIIKIPMSLNGQNYMNNHKPIKDEFPDNERSLTNNYISPSNNEMYRINTSKEINNIHNNIGFYNNDQRDNTVQNDSYRKKTIKEGGKFNNIQTTYVVISKNSNSKINLLPKTNITIDFESHKFCNPMQTVLFPKLSNYYNKGQNVTYMNTEHNIKNNQNWHYFSPYTENPRFIKKIPINNETIKTNKSENQLHIKNQYNYHNENISNNYGMNYKNYIECAIHNNKNKINNNQYNNQFMNDYYVTNKTSNRLVNTIDNCENYDYSNYAGCNTYY